MPGATREQRLLTRVMLAWMVSYGPMTASDLHRVVFGAGASLGLTLNRLRTLERKGVVRRIYKPNSLALWEYVGGGSS
jgi:hypothetical protein